MTAATPAPSALAITSERNIAWEHAIRSGLELVATYDADGGKEEFDPHAWMGRASVVLREMLRYGTPGPDGRHASSDQIRALQQLLTGDGILDSAIRSTPALSTYLEQLPYDDAAAMLLALNGIRPDEATDEAAAQKEATG